MPRIPQIETERRVKEFKINVLKGDNISTALVKAGYSKNNWPTRSKKLGKALEEVRAKFNQDYLNECAKQSFTGATVADRLIRTSKGKDDFNSTNALKVHMAYIQKITEKEQEYSQFQGQIIIPVQINVREWNKPSNQVEAELIKDSTNQQKVVDVPVTEQPSDSLT